MSQFRMRHTPAALFHTHRRTILLLAALGAGAAFLVSVVQPFQYRATMRILIIQATNPSLDAYTAVKSSEKIGRNLARIMGSSFFLDRILDTSTAIDAATFPGDERRRRRAWQRTVAAQVVSETSVMELDVFHARPAQAEAIASAVGAVLVRDAAELTGSRDVSVKVIDSPIVSRYPVRPNVPLHVALGFALGALMASGYVYLRHGA